MLTYTGADRVGLAWTWLPVPEQVWKNKIRRETGIGEVNPRGARVPYLIWDGFLLGFWTCP